jgi:hypothetical protein
MLFERFGRRPDGTLALLREGSTLPVAETRTHAGVVKVVQHVISTP